MPEVSNGTAAGDDVALRVEANFREGTGFSGSSKHPIGSFKHLINN